MARFYPVQKKWRAGPRKCGFIRDDGLLCNEERYYAERRKGNFEIPNAGGGSSSFKFGMKANGAGSGCQAQPRCHDEVDNRGRIVLTLQPDEKKRSRSWLAKAFHG
jgi:hypothetical protein